MPSPSAPLRPLTRKELTFLLILAGVQFTHIMDFMIMMPLGPQLMRLFEISPRQFGFLVAAYTFAAGAFGFISAFVVDRFDRKSALIFCYVGFTWGTIACGLAPTYEFLLAARSLAGAFGGVLGALILAAVGDSISNDKRGRAMGVMTASFSVASVFGVPFGLFLATKMNWHAPFLFVGAAASVNTLLLAIYIPSMTRHMHSGRPRPSPLQLISSITSDRNQRLALTFTFLLMLSQFSAIPFLSAYMVANVGFLESQLPYIYFVGGGMTIFTSPIVGRMADKLGKPRIFTIAAMMLMIPYYVVTHLGPTPLPWALAVTTFFFVCGNSRFIPAMAMVTSTVRPETRGSFMSINSSVQSLSSGLAALISGLIVERAANGQLVNYDLVGYISIATSFVAIYVGRKLVDVD